MRDLIMAGCCQCRFLGTRIEKVPAFQGDSSNVEVALRYFAQAKTRPFKSGSKYSISLLDLVAGAGFEPAAFRL